MQINLSNLVDSSTIGDTPQSSELSGDSAGHILNETQPKAGHLSVSVNTSLHHKRHKERF